MKKIALFLLILSTFSILLSCKDTKDSKHNQDHFNQAPDTHNESTYSTNIFQCRYTDYLKSVIPADLPNQSVYYLEKAVTVSDITTSVITAVKNGKLISISESNGEKNAYILSPDTLTTFNIAEKTYSQTATNKDFYDNVFSQVECLSKYNGLKFTSLTYNLQGEDRYAEATIFNDVLHIYVFDQTGTIPKYHIFEQSDQELVTEEIITISPQVDDTIFIIPEGYVINENQ